MLDRRRNERRDRRLEADSVVPDARDEEWFQLWTEIEQLLTSGQRAWAEDMLRGIQRTVDDTHWVTARQRQAVRAIAQARRRPHDWATRFPWPID